MAGDEQGKKAPLEQRGEKTAKHRQARRQLLKSLAAGGGAVVAGSQVLPEKWVKPVLDTVVVPAFAQASAPSMTVQLTVANDVGGPPAETFNGPGAFVADAALLAIDDLDIDGQATLINPPVPGQAVTFTLAVTGATDADIDSTNPLIAPSNPGTGVAAFDAINVDQIDSGPANFAGFTATFSSAGVPSQVITITFA